MYLKRVSQAYSHFRHFSRVYQTSHYHTSKATVVEAKYFLPDKLTGWKGIRTRYQYAKRYLMDNVFKRLTNNWFFDLPQYNYIFRPHHPSNFLFKPRSNIIGKDHATVGENRIFLPCPKNQKFNSIQAKYEQTRRLLINNILRGVTNSLAADIRRRSERQLFNGNPRPFFALVGVSLASGSGIITKEDEFKSVCWEIRVSIVKTFETYFFVVYYRIFFQESVNRMHKNMYDLEAHQMDDKLSLNDLEFGSVIAKGSNAVVYEAREISKAGNWLFNLFIIVCWNICINYQS